MKGFLFLSFVMRHETALGPHRKRERVFICALLSGHQKEMTALLRNSDAPISLKWNEKLRGGGALSSEKQEVLHVPLE